MENPADGQDENFDASDGKPKSELPAHVLEGMARGLEDVKAGRTITLEEFKEKHLSNK